MDFSTQKLTRMGQVLSKNLDSKYTKYFYDIFQSLEIDAEFSIKLKKSCVYCLAGDQTISQRNKIHKRTFMMPISIISRAKQKLQKSKKVMEMKLNPPTERDPNSHMMMNN